MKDVGVVGQRKRNRFFEVDDLLTNIVGMMIGYIGMWIGH